MTSFLLPLLLPRVVPAFGFVVLFSFVKFTAPNIPTEHVGDQQNNCISNESVVSRKNLFVFPNTWDVHLMRISSLRSQYCFHSSPDEWTMLLDGCHQDRYSFVFWRESTSASHPSTTNFTTWHYWIGWGQVSRLSFSFNSEAVCLPDILKQDALIVFWFRGIIAILQSYKKPFCEWSVRWIVAAHLVRIS